MLTTGSVMINFRKQAIMCEEMKEFVTHVSIVSQEILSDSDDYAPLWQQNWYILLCTNKVLKKLQEMPYSNRVKSSLAREETA